MLRKNCIVNNDFSFSKMAGSLVFSRKKRTMQQQLDDFLGSGLYRLTSCGFTALYAALKVLQEEHHGKTDVIIPAYTAPGLVLPIKKAGLKPLLCDISLSTFNMDMQQLNSMISSKTLAVIAVHMFGIPMDIKALKGELDGRAVIIEDCAQSLGSEINGSKTGSIADISFGSFGRGKNFSVYHGGFLSLRSPVLQQRIEMQYRSLPIPGLHGQLKNIAQHLIFSFITQPWLYGFASILTERLKSKSEQQDFSVSSMGEIHARYSAAMFGLWLNSYRERISNGRVLYDGLQGISGIKLPKLPEQAVIAFNRFPMLVDNLELKDKILRLLSAAGTEASYMYETPVHFKWELGYKSGDLPNAEYLARHLLTLPVYGSMGKDVLDKTTGIIKKALT